MKIPYRVLVVAALAFGYATPSMGDQPPEFQNPQFKAGRPIEGESLEAAIRSQDDLDALAELTSFLSRNESVEFSVFGHTDRTECGGENCSVLALRRARMIYNYLIDAKIDPKRVRQLGEFGAANYIAVEAGDTYRNQRVEIHLSFDRLNAPLR